MSHIILTVILSILIAATRLPVWIQLLLLTVIIFPVIKYKKPVLALCMVLAYSLALWQKKPLQTPQIPRNPVKISGLIEGLTQIKKHRTVFDFKPDNFTLLTKRINKIRLTWYGAPELRPGTHLTLNVKLRQPRNFQSYNVFNYQGYLEHLGIQLTGYVRKGSITQEGVISIDSARWQLRHSLLAHLTGPSAALICALVLGDKSLISPQQWRLLQNTGTIHLFVVSGLHVGLAALSGAFLGWLLFLLLQKQQSVSLPACRLFFMVLFALSYALLSGFAIPVQRAVLMLLIGLCAYWYGFKPRMSHLLGLVFILITLFQPFWWRNQGLWLSFGAVCALLLAFSNRVKQKSKIGALIKAQFVILTALAPILLFFGKPVPLTGVILNLILIPITAFFLLPGLLLCLISLPVQAGQVVWSFWDWVFQHLEILLTFFAQTKWHIIPSGQSWPALFFGVLGTFFLLLEGRIFWIMGMCFFVPVFFPYHEKIATQGVRLVFFDVGQGLAILVSTRDHNLLFDTGERYGDFYVADAVIVPFLYSNNIKHLDKLIISHKDKDHAGGQEVIERTFHPQAIFTSFGQKRSCHKSHSWRWNAVDFTFLPIHTNKKGNERSCILLIQQGQFSALLTGDIGFSSEAYLTEHYPKLLNIDLLQVPHHGSKYSSSNLFLRATSPLISVVSAGYQNRFGHPHPSAIQRVRNVGSTVFNTAVSGTLIVTKEPEKKLRIEPYNP